MEKSLHTQIGCELFVRRRDEVLLGLRRGCYGAGTWALPGGHLEFNERLVDAVCREASEEMGVALGAGQVELVSIVDDLQPKNEVHYVHVSFELRDPEFEPRVMEPDRCEEWRYFRLDDLPSNIFRPHQAILRNYLEQKLYALEIESSAVSRA